MRLNGLAIVAYVSVAVLVVGVAVVIAAEGNPPRRGIFSFRARPLEPTPAGQRPTAARRAAPESTNPGRSGFYTSRSRANRGRGSKLSQDPTSQMQGILTKPVREARVAKPASSAPSAASRRLLELRDAALDPDLNSVASPDRQPADTSAPGLPTSSDLHPTDRTPTSAALPHHRIATRPIPNQAARTGTGRAKPADLDAKPAPATGPTTAVPKAAGANAAAAAAVRGHDVAGATKTNRFLLNSPGPAIAVTATGPPTIVVGRPAAYTVVVSNRGNGAARDINVSVSLPDRIEITGSQSSVGTTAVETDGQQNSVMNWRIRQLAAHSTERLELKIVPRDSRMIDLAVHWTFAPADAVAQIEVLEPKLQMTITGPEDVLFGESKTFTITVGNPGTGDAENVVLNLLPVTPDAEAAGAREIGTLKAGTRKSVEVELTAQQAGRLQIRAHAFADGGLRAEASQDVIVRRANLQVAAAGPTMKYSGTTASYKIRVANTGDASARNVVLAAVLPAGSKYVGSTDGGTLDSQQGQVTWQIGPLRHGAVRIFDLQCVLSSAGENRLDVRSRAAGDLSAAQTVVTRVEALADLKLTINDPTGAIPVGAESEYEVRILNRGSKAAEGIQVVGFFGPSVEPVSVEGWRGQISTGQVEFEPIHRLNAGQELVLKIMARADSPGTHRFRVELTCTDPDTKLAGEESTKFYGEPSVRQAMAPTESAAGGISR